MNPTAEPDHTSNALFSKIRSHLPAIALPDPEQAPSGFEAAVLWAGIEGTASLANSLEKAGREGAEQFGRSLNAFMARLLAELGSEGGQVARLEGDELIAFFPKKVEESAETCRSRAERAAARMAEVPVGDFGLMLGISFGPVDLLRFGTPGMGRELVLAGPALGEARTNRQSAFAISQDDTPMFMMDEGAPDLEAASENLDEEKALGRLAGWLPPAVWQRLKDDPNFAGDWQRAVALCVQFEGPNYATPDGLRQLQEYYNLVQNVCSAQNGFVYRFQPGEKDEPHRLMLIFGTLLSHTNDAERALRAALQLRRLPDDLEFIREQAIGVASGTAFAGPIGTAQRRQFIVTGETLNSAMKAAEAGESKLELKRQGGLMVDRYTSERVALNFLFGEQQTLEQPGEKLLVRIAPLLTERKFISALKRYWKDEIKLVSRRDELAQIDRLASEALGGQTRIVAITGSEGIGKSAILGDASRHWLARAGSGAVGVCYEYGEGRPYLGWAGVLAWLSDFVDADTRMARVGKINMVISRYAPNYPELVAPVQQILNVTPFDRKLFADLIKPGQARDHFFEFFSKLIEGKSAEVPLMIELENLQWCDQPSLDLLAYLVNQVQSAVVFGLTSRTSIENLPESALRIELGPLSPEESRQLIGQTSREVLEQELEQIGQAAQGNPLHLIQLVRYWQQHRALPTSSEEIMLSRLLNSN